MRLRSEIYKGMENSLFFLTFGTLTSGARIGEEMAEACEILLLSQIQHPR